MFSKTRFTVTNRLFRVEHETASRASRERKTITYTGVQSSDYVLCTVCDSIVVSIPRCHRGDRGSIPRRAVFAFFCMRSPRRRGGDARGSDAPLFISKLAPVAEIRRFPCAAVWVRFLPAKTFWRKSRISRQKRCQNSSSAYVEGKGGAGRAAHPGGAPASNPCPRRLSRATPRPPSRAVVSSRPLEVARGVVVPASSSPAPAMDTTTSTPIGNEQRRRSGSRLAAAHRSPR